MALLSRRPLRDLRVRPLNEAHAIEATLDHEGAEVTLLCVHPAPPAAGLTPSHLSALGKILASAIMIMGYGIIAVPTGIVSVELAGVTRKRITTQACPECGAGGHDGDAVHCKYCGAKI